ncbi:hypothetical protein EJB05_17500, partial [Eragrostis curvula]
LERQQGVRWRREAFPQDCTVGVLDDKIAGVEKGNSCAPPRARLAVPCHGAIDISEDQIAIMVQRNLGAPTIHRDLWVCRPHDGLIHGVGEPNREGESIRANFIEATGEISTWRGKEVLFSVQYVGLLQWSYFPDASPSNPQHGSVYDKEYGIIGYSELRLPYRVFYVIVWEDALDLLRRRASA